MRAIGIPSYGSPDVLTVVELPLPSPGPGQVRIKVAAAAVNPADQALRAGADIPKNDPADVVRAVLDGIEAGRAEVIADEFSAVTKANLALDPGQVYGPAPMV
jgi:NADPH:quinone reductase-like Zn-dependent oxidoreductase